MIDFKYHINNNNAGYVILNACIHVTKCNNDTN